MRSILCCILSFIAIVSLAQEKPFSITTLSLKPESKYYNTEDSTIRYPIFHFKDTAIETQINRSIRTVVEDLGNSEDHSDRLPIESLLQMAAQNGLTDFELDTITFISDYLLAFQIGIGTVGAYPTFTTEYFVFDLKNGKRLEVTYLINPSLLYQFDMMLNAKQKKAVSAFRKTAATDFKLGTIDKNEYDFILRQTESFCYDNFDPLRYSISKNGLDILINCEFPHALQALDQTGSVHFSKEECITLLRKEYSNGL